MTIYHPSEDNPLSKLTSLGLTLPQVKNDPKYLNFRTSRDGQIYISGQLPYQNGSLAAQGLVGEKGSQGVDVEVAVAREMMLQATLNALAVAAEAVGGLKNLRVVQMLVFVASAPGFSRHSHVADPGSELLIEVLSEYGRHARTAIGVAGLPRNSPVEVQMVCEPRI